MTNVFEEIEAIANEIEKMEEEIEVYRALREARQARYERWLEESIEADKRKAKKAKEAKEAKEAKKPFNYNDTIERFKPNDSGRFGKAFEINVKHYLNGNRGNADKVSAKGKTDVTYKGKQFEIKSNCGEINESIHRNDFILYTYDNESTWNEPQNARVIPTADFLAIVDACGLRRKKVSSNGQLKESIQSYKNSKRKSALWISAVDKYPTLEQWLNK